MSIEELFAALCLLEPYDPLYGKRGRTGYSRSRSKPWGNRTLAEVKKQIPLYILERGVEATIEWRKMKTSKRRQYAMGSFDRTVYLPENLLGMADPEEGQRHCAKDSPLGRFPNDRIA